MTLTGVFLPVRLLHAVLGIRAYAPVHAGRYAQTQLHVVRAIRRAYAVGRLGGLPDKRCALQAIRGDRQAMYVRRLPDVRQAAARAPHGLAHHGQAAALDQNLAHRAPVLQPHDQLAVVRVDRRYRRHRGRPALAEAVVVAEAVVAEAAEGGADNLK